jgi:hypothetical protein
VKHLSVAPLSGRLLEKLAREKHSSLLQKSINYGHKKFYNIVTRLVVIIEVVVELIFSKVWKQELTIEISILYGFSS